MRRNDRAIIAQRWQIAVGLSKGCENSDT